MLSLKLRAILFPFQMEPRREELLHELGEMWDEIGEGEDDRRGMLQALEEECLNVYRAKVEQVRHHRAQLRREIADSVAEVAAICATIGEPPTTVQTACSSLQGTGSLKEELGSIAPELAEMRRRREERRRQFSDVTERVNRIQHEMNLGGGGVGQPRVVADGSDLTLTKLEELRAYLQHLQSEKESRTKKVTELMALLHSSSLVLGMDPREFSAAQGGEQTAGHFSDAAIARLASEIERLREIKRSRMEKLQDLVASMLELWHLMDTPAEEQKRFQGVACNIAASEDEITEPGALSTASIRNVEAEVVRLETLKECRMKDLVAKKYEELKEIRRRARLPEEEDGDMFGAGDGDAERALVLERLEVRISEAKDLEFSRKDVLERMDKWQAALEEESWLEEYSRNENRYNVGKGTHLVLKRAEKARALVGKMPAMAEALTAKVVAWEKERGVKFERCCWRCWRSTGTRGRRRSRSGRGSGTRGGCRARPRRRRRRSGTRRRWRGSRPRTSRTSRGRCPWAATAAVAPAAEGEAPGRLRRRRRGPARRATSSRPCPRGAAAATRPRCSRQTPSSDL
ncbi:unnamed protein product [Urochloa decumbens]|uniref:65-kDa microtubule-associated protein 3 n=1 Tax=Urochloa decumbens TaxID=240449 RepID=A0ABC9ENJ2_9POAL